MRDAISLNSFIFLTPLSFFVCCFPENAESGPPFPTIRFLGAFGFELTGQISRQPYQRIRTRQ
jgi:hypothetical protein